jgi:nucleoside-diphosphate-sugar epimerase
MDVGVAGGHGKIGRQLLGLRAERGDRARGLIRNPDHAGDLEAVGAEAVLCDMESEEDLAQIPRADVAATRLRALDEDATVGKAFVLLGGDTPIEEALRALA